VWDWEPGSYRPVSQTERVPLRDAPQQWVDERFYAIVTDLVGTPTELVHPDGTLAWRAQATLWGASTVPPGDAPYTPLRFPGQYHDPETGLHYNFHRYYDPTTGRYASPDPLGLAPSPNPQAYVSNPTGWIDPMGLAPAGCVPTTTAYRVEGPPLIGPDGKVVKGKEGNQLLHIDQHGNVTIPKNQTLYLNFGQADRANEYLDKRIQQNFHGIQIKSFQVPTSYVDRLRDTAVMENRIRTDDPLKLRPVVADPTKAVDNFGLRPNHLDELRSQIVPGSGRIHAGHV
jgi:RHS repeat-associated protein